MKKPMISPLVTEVKEEEDIKETKVKQKRTLGRYMVFNVF